MTFGLTLLLVLAAFLATIASALTPPRCPLWIAVLLLCVAMLAGLLPR
jgi:hypothetical protein